MLVETKKSSSTESLSSKSESIFNYYSVRNEINFINKVDRNRVSDNELRFYIKENVSRFLGEFAGRVPYTTITYTLKNGQLEYAGINLLDSYQKTARMAGVGSREEDELHGHRAINYGLNEGFNVFQLSPSKIANYGFGFYFQHNANQPGFIKEYILRYEEPLSQTTTSQKIQEIVNPNQKPRSKSDFLRNPNFLSNTNSRSELSQILHAVGISDIDIQKSQRFEEQIKTELLPWINDYVDSVFNQDPQTAEYILTAIYNRAVVIRKAIDQKPGYSPINYELRHTSKSIPIDLHYYAVRKATVTEGGSCPVTKKSWSDPLSPSSLVQEFSLGNTMSDILNSSESSHFVCPNCDHHATGPIGNQCPGCKITKEEAMEKGLVTC